MRRGSSRPDYKHINVDSKFRLPDSNPLSLTTGLILVGGLTVIGLGIGAAIGTQIFFGTAAMIGLAILVESNAYLLWLVEHGNIWIDILIFAGSIYAMAQLGTTIAGGAIIMGVEYTGVYAPAIRRRAKRRVINNQ